MPLDQAASCRQGRCCSPSGSTLERGAGCSGGVHERSISTARGFEPLRAEPNGFLVHHLSHSVTLSLLCTRACGHPPGRCYLRAHAFLRRGRSYRAPTRIVRALLNTRHAPLVRRHEPPPPQRRWPGASSESQRGGARPPGSQESPERDTQQCVAVSPRQASVLIVQDHTC